MHHRQRARVHQVLACLAVSGALAGCAPKLQEVAGPAALATAAPSERYSGSLVYANGHIVFTSYPSDNSNDHSIRRVNTTGGDITTLASGQGGIEELATDGSFVYWMSRNPTTFERTIRRLSIDGGTATTLASGIAGVVSVAGKCFSTDGVSLYFSSNGAGVRKMPVAGGTITTLAPTTVAESCTVSEGVVYYKNGTSFYRVSAAGGVPEKLADGAPEAPAVELVVTGGQVYVLDFSTIHGFPIGGGPVVQRVNGISAGRDLATDGVYLYFNDLNTGSMGRTGLSDFITTRLYSLSQSVGIALDATHIYWVDYGYRLMRGTR